MAEDMTALWSDDEWRAAMTSADINDLPDDAFAYIEDGGTKDDEGKTTPRDKRHFPIHDAAHVRNALARAADSPFGDKAMPKIKEAAKKFGIKVAGEETGDEVRPVIPSRRTKKPRHRSGPSIGIEVRHFAAEGLEVRAAKAGSGIEVVGTPIVYNTPYGVRDMFGEFQETMAPGVASSVLPTADCRFLFNHQGAPHARTANGTLTFNDGEDGLGMTAVLDDERNDSHDLARMIQRGDISQMSCGFTVADDEWSPDETERTIFRFGNLLDVSAVTYPASPTTNIAVAQRMMLDVPVESRARVRRMWAVSRDLKDGKEVSREDVDLLASGLHVLADASDVSEDRAMPTDVDKKMPAKLSAIHDAIHDAMKTQMTDPDNATDPDDVSIMEALKSMSGLSAKVLGLQGVDGSPSNPNERDVQPVVPPGEAGGPQGDQMAPSPDPATAQDGTGSRSAAALKLEIELMEIRKRKDTAA